MKLSAKIKKHMQNFTIALANVKYKQKNYISHVKILDNIKDFNNRILVVYDHFLK